MTRLAWPPLDVAGHTLRTAGPEDAAGVAALMADPEVARWWHQDWDPERWGRCLRRLLDGGHALPLVLTRAGRVAGYVELYLVRHDPLGDQIAHDASDLGVHLALDGSARGHGLGTQVLATVRGRARSVVPGCRRVVAEPDVLNERSVRTFRRAGFRPDRLVDLPGKRAQLLVASTAAEDEHRAEDEHAAADGHGTGEPVHDVVAVGAGPFNLGLVALADPVDDLDLVCFDREPEVTWHRGLMLDGALLQVSFLADLVSLVAPTSRHSFLEYLRDQDRMYPFYVRERFHPTRAEYEDYLRWVARRVRGLRLGHRVEQVTYDEHADLFEVEVATAGVRRRHRARHVVLGVGTEPRLPDALREVPRERLVHSGDYLHRLDDVLAADRVTVVGSGQSGAECFLDLLRRRRPGQHLAWVTRSESFAPLDYSKLVLEMTTPQYVDHFHALPEERRDELVRRQWRHYKGISTETLDEIHDALYARALDEKAAPVELRQGVAVTGAVAGGLAAGGGAADGVTLHLECSDTGRTQRHRTDLVVAATGYAERAMPLAPQLARLLHTDRRGRLVLHRDHSVSADGALDGRVFVANADLHSHGPAAPDLGLGAVRNAGILNRVAGREIYPVPRRTAFTTFGDHPQEGR